MKLLFIVMAGNVVIIVVFVYGYSYYRINTIIILVIIRYCSQHERFVYKSIKKKKNYKQ